MVLSHILDSVLKYIDQGRSDNMQFIRSVRSIRYLPIDSFLCCSGLSSLLPGAFCAQLRKRSRYICKKQGLRHQSYFLLGNNLQIPRRLIQLRSCLLHNVPANGDCGVDVVRGAQEGDDTAEAEDQAAQDGGRERVRPLRHDDARPRLHARKCHLAEGLRTAHGPHARAHRGLRRSSLYL